MIALTQTTVDPMPPLLVEACLNAVNFGVLLVDAAGDILFSNSAAANIIQRCGGADTAVHAVHVDAINPLLFRHRIRNLVSQSARNPVASKYSHGDFEVDIVAYSAPNAGTVVFIRNSVFEPSDQFSRRTQKLYGLTPQETRIAYELATGSPVDAIAERLDVKQNTVRMHLKRVYEKTGTHSQSQLVARLICNIFLSGIL